MPQAINALLVGVDGQTFATTTNPVPVELTAGSVNITAVLSGSISLGASTASIGSTTILGSVTVANATASLLNATITGTTNIGGSLPAGTNAIGSTTIIGSLPSGTNTIGTATVTGTIAIDQSNAGTTNRVQAGKTATVSLTAAMSTTTAYTPNIVVGGLLTFPNAFGTVGSGILQTVDLNIKNIQTNSFLFVPFNGNPTNSTWTDHSISAIATSDVFAARDPVALTGGTNALGTATVYSSPGLGIAMAPGSTTMYGILLATSTSAAFSTTSDIQITIKTLQD